MKAKNQLVVLSGILVLLTTATMAASYVAQPANAQTSPGNSGSAYGNQVIKPNAQTGTWGSQVSSAAQDGSGHGIGDFRANGCKLGGGNNGQGSPGVC
jgi:hypothetical protein